MAKVVLIQGCVDDGPSRFVSGAAHFICGKSGNRFQICQREKPIASTPLRERATDNRDRSMQQASPNGPKFRHIPDRGRPTRNGQSRLVLPFSIPFFGAYTPRCKGAPYEVSLKRQKSCLSSIRLYGWHVCQLKKVFPFRHLTTRVPPSCWVLLRGYSATHGSLLRSLAAVPSYAKALSVRGMH